MARTFICVHDGRTCGNEALGARQLSTGEWACHPADGQERPDCWQLVEQLGEEKGARGFWVTCRDCGEPMGPLPRTDSFREFASAAFVVEREHSRGHGMSRKSFQRSAVVALVMVAVLDVIMLFAVGQPLSLWELAGWWTWFFGAPLAAQYVRWEYYRRQRRRRGSPGGP